MLRKGDFSSAKPGARPNSLSVYEYLDSTLITYERVNHPATNTLYETAQSLGIPEAQIARAVLLQDENGVVMSILPSNYLLDFKILSHECRREFEPVSPASLSALFEGCEPGSYPPLPEWLGVHSMCDEALLQFDEIYFEPGSHQTLIRLSKKSFLHLLGDSWVGQFSAPPHHLGAQGDDAEAFHRAVSQFLPKRLKERIDGTFELPILPPMADKILRMRSDPNADAVSLARIVEKDPSLSAQVMCWASSPYYAYSGTIDSVEDAIIHVLGFDLVMNLALGIAIGREMKVPLDGPLGLKAHWRHALYTATLASLLAQEMPRERRPRLGLVYLSGLLHNFGFLLLGQLFLPQFYLLNRFVAINAHVPITRVESYALGVGHEQIGAWLMQSWKIPDEVVVATRHHHEADFFDGAHANYAQLVLLAGRYLKRHGMGDADNGEIPSKTLEFLGISRESADECFNKIWQNHQDLDLLGKQLHL